MERIPKLLPVIWTEGPSNARQNDPDNAFGLSSFSSHLLRGIKVLSFCENEVPPIGHPMKRRVTATRGMLQLKSLLSP